MACITFRAVLLFIFLFSNSTVCFSKISQNIILATDELPPYSFYDNGRLTGIAVNIVRELMQMDGYSGKISMLPWKRALNYLESHPVLFFPFAMPSFLKTDCKLIGPIMIDSFVFAVHSSDKRFFQNIEDFKSIQIGVNGGTPTSIRLQHLGFQNVQNVNSEKLNAKKLVLGRRIDAWYCPYLILLYTMRRENISEKLIRIEYKDIDVEMFIGASSKVPVETIERWQRNFDEMKENGSYQSVIYKSILQWEHL